MTTADRALDMHPSPPHTHTQLKSLRELDVSGNQLTEVPVALATLPKLEVWL